MTSSINLKMHKKQTHHSSLEFAHSFQKFESFWIELVDATVVLVDLLGAEVMQFRLLVEFAHLQFADAFVGLL